MAPVLLQFGPATAALHRPAGPVRVAILLMHRSANYLNHIGAVELCKRGFLILCINSRYQNNEVQLTFEKLPLDVRAGVEFLRREAGIRSVVLFAHSGGGPVLSFYQALAENGLEISRGPHKLWEGGDDLDGLPPADGIVFADAHPGNAVLVLRGLNPSIPDELNPPTSPIIADLDPYNPDNGYNPDGPSHYSEAFRTRYYTAQSGRMNRLIEQALETRRLMRRGVYPYSDNDIFVIPRGGPQGSGPGASAYLWLTDPSIEEVNRTVHPVKLLKNDGSISLEKVHSLAAASPDIAKRHATFDQGTKVLSVRSFLSANAIRSGNAIDDIDFESSNNSTLSSVRRISVPMLFAAMGGFFLIRDNETLAREAKAQDKEFIVVEGASHFIVPNKPSEKTSGEFGNSVRNFFDYTRDWINRRF